jgi:hypothetical protein
MCSCLLFVKLGHADEPIAHVQVKV